VAKATAALVARVRFIVLHLRIRFEPDFAWAHLDPGGVLANSGDVASAAPSWTDFGKILREIPFPMSLNQRLSFNLATSGIAFRN